MSPFAHALVPRSFDVTLVKETIECWIDSSHLSVGWHISYCPAVDIHHAECLVNHARLFARVS